jgi:hypothetical protein
MWQDYDILCLITIRTEHAPSSAGLEERFLMCAPLNSNDGRLNTLYDSSLTISVIDDMMLSLNSLNLNLKLFATGKSNYHWSHHCSWSSGIHFIQVQTIRLDESSCSSPWTLCHVCSIVITTHFDFKRFMQIVLKSQDKCASIYCRINVIHESENLIVVDKPASIPVRATKIQLFTLCHQTMMTYFECNFDGSGSSDWKLSFWIPHFHSRKRTRSCSSSYVLQDMSSSKNCTVILPKITVWFICCLY